MMYYFNCMVVLRIDHASNISQILSAGDVTCGTNCLVADTGTYPWVYQDVQLTFSPRPTGMYE